MGWRWIVLACLFVAIAPITHAQPALPTQYALGISYQGPGDRSWRGEYWAWWADDRFDAGMVEDDFTRARAAGIAQVRIFIQRELLQDIRRNLWGKLDAVLDTATRLGIGLIITFGDYDETRVSEVARVSGLIARRYAGHPAIAAYDLGNEPSFWILQSARYPDRSRPPLQSTRLIDIYGERAARIYVDAFRLGPEGRKGPLAVPDWMSGDETYHWHNHWVMSHDLAREGLAWAARTGRPPLEYVWSADGAHWGELVAALDATYEAWLLPRVNAVREADPSKPLTVGHHDALLMSLPANRHLDFQSPHLYMPPDAAGLGRIRATLAALRARFPSHPIMLGEFGVRTTEPGERVAAIYESAVWLAGAIDSWSGAAKWMLTDTREGTDSMGMFGTRGEPKVLARFGPALAELTRDSGTIEASGNATTPLCFVFRSARAVAVGGTCNLTERAEIRSAAGGLVAAIRDGQGYRALAAEDDEVTLRLDSVEAPRRASATIDPTPLALTIGGDEVRMRLRAGTWYSIRAS